MGAAISVAAADGIDSKASNGCRGRGCRTAIMGNCEHAHFSTDDPSMTCSRLGQETTGKRKLAGCSSETRHFPLGQCGFWVCPSSTPCLDEEGQEGRKKSWRRPFPVGFVSRPTACDGYSILGQSTRKRAPGPADQRSWFRITRSNSTRVGGRVCDVLIGTFVGTEEGCKWVDGLCSSRTAAFSLVRGGGEGSHIAGAISMVWLEAWTRRFDWKLDELVVLRKQIGRLTADFGHARVEADFFLVACRLPIQQSGVSKRQLT